MEIDRERESEWVIEKKSNRIIERYGDANRDKQIETETVRQTNSKREEDIEKTREIETEKDRNREF